MKPYQYDETKDGCAPKKITNPDKRAKWVTDKHDKERHFTPPKAGYTI